jgi:hypothetical protein
MLWTNIPDIRILGSMVKEPVSQILMLKISLSVVAAAKVKVRSTVHAYTILQVRLSIKVKTDLKISDS